MNVVTVIILIIIGIVCAFVHKNKGYSPIAGFCWGFFFSIIGLIVVLLEKDKKEHDADMADKKGLSMGQWIAIFLGVGIIGIIIFFVVMRNLQENDEIGKEGEYTMNTENGTDGKRIVKLDWTE